MIKSFTRENWLVKSGVMRREIDMMVTPNVVREVRNHFNCSELEGAELEDQGEEGTVLTHWEKRVFEVIFYTAIYFLAIIYTYRMKQ